MHRIRTTAMALLFATATAGAALAQDAPGTPEQPFNVTPSQSFCAEGFAANDLNGDGVITPDEIAVDGFVESADTNGTGYLTPVEFNNACSKQLFRQLEMQDG